MTITKPERQFWVSDFSQFGISPEYIDSKSLSRSHYVIPFNRLRSESVSHSPLGQCFAPPNLRPKAAPGQNIWGWRSIFLKEIVRFLVCWGDLHPTSVSPKVPVPQSQSQTKTTTLPRLPMVLWNMGRERFYHQFSDRRSSFTPCSQPRGIQYRSSSGLRLVSDQTTLRLCESLINHLS